VLLLGAAEVLLALWSVVLAAPAVVLGAAAEPLVVVLVEDVLLEAEPDWQDSEIIFTLSTLKLLSACIDPESCTV
jgi:hypothetical protein